MPEPRQDTLELAPGQEHQIRDTGQLPVAATDPNGATLYYSGGGALGPPAPVSSGFLGAVGGDIGDLARAIYAAGPGTIERLLKGELPPGAPETEEAARETAATFGMGGAPKGALGSGTIIRTRARPTAPAELSAPNIGMGSEAPLFDLSRLAERPSDVAQVDIPRYVPPRGVPEGVIASMSNPENIARFRQMVERGIDLGGLGWYGTQPLREAFIERLGAVDGEMAYSRYLDYVGATSPRSAVQPNIRTASYYHALERQGIQPPELVPDPGKQARPAGPIPSPYGPFPVRTHLANVWNILRGQGYPLSNPKSPSFAANLKGNWQPLTADVHNVRGWDLRDTKGNPVDMPSMTEYGHVEDVQQEMARQMGIDPAQLQASGWVGGEAETGVRSGVDPFMAHLERRIRYTAAQRGESPLQTLDKFIKGERPLLSAGDPAGMVAGAEATRDRQSPHLKEAMSSMSLTPQEQNLYQHHLSNLEGSGKVVQPNGDISTLLQTTVERDGRTYNIPTVWDGKVLPGALAVQMAAKAGWDKWPSYKTRAEAEARYKKMHEFMDRDALDFRNQGK